MTTTRLKKKGKIWHRHSYQKTKQKTIFVMTNKKYHCGGGVCL